MRAWTSVSAVAVHHGWAKEPSDYTGKNISDSISYTIKKKNPFIDVFYHQSSERHPGHTAYDIVYDITFGKYNIVYDIVYGIVYDIITI
jgi:hypothetical protein